MNKELIEKLTNNLAMYKCLSVEEQAYFRKIGKENCLFLSPKGVWKDGGDEDFIPDNRYRISPDYQSEQLPNLGCATTKELLIELATRIHGNHSIDLDYRTVDTIKNR